VLIYGKFYRTKHLADETGDRNGDSMADLAYGALPLLIGNAHWSMCVLGSKSLARPIRHAKADAASNRRL